MINIESIINIAKEAGEIIMSYYNRQSIGIDYKDDLSPVTHADLASNKLICESLAKLYPSIPVVSEESERNSHCNSQVFWLVDPLDATQSFIDRSGEFTVNIGLIIDSKPKFGVVYAPLTKQLYYVGENEIAYKQLNEEDPIVIMARKSPETGSIVLTSVLSNNQEKLDLYLRNKKIDKIMPISSSIKICMIAQGMADLYPRFGKTMEWDTAAAHAILKAAGGNILDLTGNELVYGSIKNGYSNPEFIAFGEMA